MGSTIAHAHRRTRTPAGTRTRTHARARTREHLTPTTTNQLSTTNRKQPTRSNLPTTPNACTRTATTPTARQLLRHFPQFCRNHAHATIATISANLSHNTRRADSATKSQKVSQVDIAREYLYLYGRHCKPDGCASPALSGGGGVAWRRSTGGGGVAATGASHARCRAHATQLAANPTPPRDPCGQSPMRRATVALSRPNRRQNRAQNRHSTYRLIIYCHIIAA